MSIFNPFATEPVPSHLVYIDCQCELKIDRLPHVEFACQFESGLMERVAGPIQKRTHDPGDRLLQCNGLVPVVFGRYFDDDARAGESSLCRVLVGECQRSLVRGDFSIDSRLGTARNQCPETGRERPEYRSSVHARTRRGHDVNVSSVESGLD